MDATAASGDQVEEQAAAAGKAAAPRPLPYLLLVILPALPALVAAGLLQLLGPLDDPLSTAELGILRRAFTEPFLSGALTLIAVLAVHVCVCVAGIALAWAILRRIYLTRLVAVGAAELGLLLGLGLLWAADETIAVYDLSYYTFIDLYRGTGVESSLLDPRILDLPALALAVLVPVGLGIVGVTMMTAATLGQVQELGEPGAVPDLGYEARMRFAYDRLKRCLYVLSVGLVTSTVAASLFFHLPAKLSAASLAGGPPVLEQRYQPAGEAALEKVLKGVEIAGKLQAAQNAELSRLRGKFDAFAGELSIFWGAVFTLTLLAAAGLPIAMLQQKLRRYSEKPGHLAEGLAAQERLVKAGVLSQSGDQAKLLLALIAPLASGPISNFVQAAAGS